MCLAVPAEVIELLGPTRARVDMAGVKKVIATELLPDLAPGDWVLIHVGYALAKIDPQQARETLALLAEAFPQDGSEP